MPSPHNRLPGLTTRSSDAVYDILLVEPSRIGDGGTFPLSVKITAATQSSHNAIENVPSFPGSPPA